MIEQVMTSFNKRAHSLYREVKFIMYDWNSLPCLVEWGFLQSFLLAVSEEHKDLEI